MNLLHLELYNSIRLIQHKKYAVQEGGINVENIQNILDSISSCKEPELPSLKQIALNE